MTYRYLIGVGICTLTSSIQILEQRENVTHISPCVWKGLWCQIVLTDFRIKQGWHVSTYLKKKKFHGKGGKPEAEITFIVPEEYLFSFPDLARLRARFQKLAK